MCPRNFNKNHPSDLTSRIAVGYPTDMHTLPDTVDICQIADSYLLTAAPGRGLSRPLLQKNIERTVMTDDDHFALTTIESGKSFVTEHDPCRQVRLSGAPFRIS